MQYRREVDGLRALAVVPVILFHAGFETFSGGFVGVDIFFVISGYLITTILLTELESGKFSLVTFYERRARRILPALFLVLSVCLPFAWFWLLPGDMKNFAQSVAAVSLFASNVLFWRQSGYFESAAEHKPLLHTWSLAVEEQFYTLFPLLLMLAWRLGRKWVLALLVAAAVISLSVAQWGSMNNPTAAFFLLPTRGWELAIGAMAALYLFQRQVPAHSATKSEWLSALGLVLIGLSVLAYSKKTPFPGLYALVPTVGASLIIVFSTPQTLTGRLLGSKALVGIGLISYSAYLWHQPLFAFARHRTFNDSGHLLAAALATGSLGLAYLSWRFVEQPFRRSGVISRVGVFRFAALGSAGFLVLGMAGHLTSGFESRIAGDRGDFLNHFENSVPEWKYFERAGIEASFGNACGFFDIAAYRQGTATRTPVANLAPECYTRNPAFKHAVLVWGDSHAQQLRGGLKQHLPQDWQLLQVASSGCRPRLGAHPSTKDFCEQSNWFAYHTVSETRPDVVVIGQFGDHDPARMNEFTRSLTDLGVKQVIFTGPTPRWKLDLPKIVATRLWDDTPRRTLIGVDRDTLTDNEKLKLAFNASESARLISLVDYFCDPSGCLVYAGDDRKSGLTTWDYGHLTPPASALLARDVLVPAITNSPTRILQTEKFEGVPHAHADVLSAPHDTLSR